MSQEAWAARVLPCAAHVSYDSAPPTPATTTPGDAVAASGLLGVRRRWRVHASRGPLDQLVRLGRPGGLASLGGLGSDRVLWPRGHRGHSQPVARWFVSRAG